MSSILYDRIRDQVRRVPSGTVTSYGDIARASGLRRGAQIVGWALRSLPPDSDVPWQRVVNQKGRISIVNPKMTKTLQRTLLEEEGVTVEEKDGWYVIDRSFWWYPPEA